MKNPYCVIPDDRKVETSVAVQQIKAAVLICLYYEDQVAEYQEYIKRIPDFIDVYIISSKDSILNCFASDRFRKIKKENRGRDISAFLVSAKAIIFQYEYICYIHDKKEKNIKMKSFTDFWRKNLWDNMLGSEIYIQNVMELFERNPQMGMLVPLPPHKGDKGVWLAGGWGKNFENTKKLASQLNLDVSILKEFPPFTYSTVFWTRSIVLKKLFVKEWDYSDFPDEPIKDDGEINHAIERILQYVVEDAGYEIKIGISSSFASIFFQQIHDELQYLWDNLEKIFGIRNYYSLEHYQNRYKEVAVFFEKYEHVFLYGAGQYGTECLTLCRNLEILPEGILVTSMQDNQKDVGGIPVIAIEQLKPDQSTGIIVTVSQVYRSEVVEELESRGFFDYMFF